MRSYRQYCALARSLDIVGDRWTLLIIRELFARDSRYSDLRDGLPGIATNLLADRLRQLQATGLVESYDAPRPVRATVYRLTERGRQLGPALRDLVQWGMPLLKNDRGDDEFRPQWLMLGLRVLYEDVDVAGVSDLTILISNEYEPVTLKVNNGTVEVSLGSLSAPEVELEADPQDVVSFLSGTLEPYSPGEVTIRGSDEAVNRLHGLIDRVRNQQLVDQ